MNMGEEAKERLSKFVIAVDIDEVLAQYVKAYCGFHNNTHGTDFKVCDFHTYKFWEVTGGTREEATDSVYAFHETAFFEHLEPVFGAQAALQELAEISSVELHVVTSRQENITEATHRWLGKHFPGVFLQERIHIGNHWGKAGARKSKPEMCSSIGARILIDDSRDYCREIAEFGIPALLFDLDGSYGWNKEEGEGHDLVCRVLSWEEVLVKIKELL
eukprot:TRINITY_DN90490_c0_g1_i1.p1 TRINITY_DN90490_c0_g1~~TRINITY_DN90490_c0_g1_i1.p1  ORF type:complete len:217 (-),score=32.40 TRINITY_DN90490_c0_g1_i1:85-735(-)